MTADEREVLYQLIDNAERGVAACSECSRITPETLTENTVFCDSCERRFQAAFDFEMAHRRFILTDTEIVEQFNREIGKYLTDDELALLKVYMLEYECEDATTVVEAIKKITASMYMRDPTKAKLWEENSGI